MQDGGCWEELGSRQKTERCLRDWQSHSGTSDLHWQHGEWNGCDGSGLGPGLRMERGWIQRENHWEVGMRREGS